MTPTTPTQGEMRLAPCPFCGGEAWLNDYEAKYSDLPSKSRSPQCRSCGASLGYLTTPAKAAEAWNRRAAPPVVGIDALSECLSALHAIKANGGDPEDVNRATCAIERVEGFRFAESAKQAIDPRLTEWGYSTTEAAITHLGKLLEDQAAFDGLASPDKVEKGR